MREHMPWMVDIHASSVFSACSVRPPARSAPFTRDLISPAAFDVKVMAKTWSMSVKYPLSNACTMRRVSVNVLPLPAPAA